MSVISLLTDFGIDDNFVGVMKAVILNINPKVQIVDLCHNVKPQDIGEAAFLLMNSFKYFPKCAIHLVVVDPGVGSKRKKILVKTKNYYFIAPDNGVLSPALECEDVQGIIEITKEEYFLKPISDTFHGRDVFAPAAAYLSLGKKIDNFGKRIKSIKHLNIAKPRLLKNEIIGEVIYIDHFGNLITNITKNTFEEFTKDSDFKICIGNTVIKKISHSYREEKKENLLAVFGSFGNLEISIREGNAKESLSLDKGVQVQIIKM